MAAMKLYFGENPVGGEVDLAEFEQLQTDVEGKYDKGNPAGLEGGAMKYKDAVAMETAVLEKFESGDEQAIPDKKRDYADAAAMESAVKGNAGEIVKIREEVADVLSQLGSENITAEFGKYFPKYGLGDDDQESLIYDSAAKMGVVVQRNEQGIIDNAAAITAGDAATLKDAKSYADTQDATNLQTAKDYADTKDSTNLQAAKDYADTQDETNLKAANDYTDDAIKDIPGVEGLEEFEEKVDELDKDAIRNWNSAAGGDLGTSDGGVATVAVRAKLPDTPDPNTLYIVTG
jgi:hypothetical protein